MYCHMCCLYFQNNCTAHNEPSQVLKELKDNRAANCDCTKAQAQDTHELISVKRKWYIKYYIALYRNYTCAFRRLGHFFFFSHPPFSLWITRHIFQNVNSYATGQQPPPVTRLAS